MKKLLFLATTVFVLFSCSTEDVQVSNNELGKILNFELVVSDLENSLSNSTDESVIFEKHEILDLNGQSYLRSYSEDFVTTTLLQKTVKGYQSRGISCTSKGCASSSTECVPKADGKSCTSCFFGDCTKTVSSGISNHQ